MSFYDHGPNRDFHIRFVGEMNKVNGEYEWQNEKGKHAMQVILHALYQVKDEIKKNVINSDMSQLSHDGIYFFWMKQTNHYSITTRSGMTMLSVYEKGPYSYDIEFFSPNQFKLFGDSLLDYADDHASLHGQAK